MAHPEGKGQELALPSRPTGRTHQTSLDVGPVTTLRGGEPGAVRWGGCSTVLQAEGFMNSKWEGLEPASRRSGWSLEWEGPCAAAPLHPSRSQA